MKSEIDAYLNFQEVKIGALQYWVESAMKNRELPSEKEASLNRPWVETRQLIALVRLYKQVVEDNCSGLIGLTNKAAVEIVSDPSCFLEPKK